MEGVLGDIGHSIRILRQRPGFNITAVAALALGIGANTAIFSIVNAALLRPLPYPDPGRIVIFTNAQPSPAKFNVWREQTNVFEDISAYRFGSVNMTGVDRPEQVQTAFVSAGYFRLFGQLVARGRAFTAVEDRPEGGDVVVFSDAFWKRAFGGDPRMIGRTISFDGRPYEVIGIMAPGAQNEAPTPFSFNVAVREPIDIWMPLQIDPNSGDQNVYLNVAARLKPGVALHSAMAQFQLAMQEFRRRFPGADTPSQSVFTLEPLRDALVGDNARASLAVLSGAVGLVLLIACANVANLLLIRATDRKREIAIRAAVGARRGRIVRQLLTESVLLSAMGGALGLVLGMLGIRALLALNTAGYSRIGDHGPAVAADWRVLLFTLTVSLTTGILFGIVPALQASRGDLGQALKEGFGGSAAGLRQNRVRSGLVVAQMTLALVLSIGSGLLIRSFIALRSVNPGFDTHHVLTLRISLTAPRFQKTAGVAALARDSVERISALPGVAAAAVTCCLPFSDGAMGDVIIVGRPLNGRSHGNVNVTTISPGYFEVYRIPVLRGRAFTERDGGGAAPAVIVSGATARRFWPGDDPFGAAIKSSLVFPEVPTRQWRIIGVCGDVHADGLSRGAPPIVYFPIAQAPDVLNAYLVRWPTAWVVRTRGEPYSPSSDSTSPAIENALRRASGLPVSSVRTMDEVSVESTASREFNMLLLSVFGGSALLLAAIGIYGLMAYSVQQRTREIGIRVAIGAESSQIRSMVVFEGMRLALAGIVLGVVASFGLTHLIAGFLFGVEASDATVFTAVPIILSAVSLFAVWLPARQAAGIDPMKALRCE